MSKMQMRNARELTPTKRLERIFGGPNIENIRIYSKNSKLVYHIIFDMDHVVYTDVLPSRPTIFWRRK